MNNNIDLPKKVNAFDRIRIKLRKILGYRDGEKFTFTEKFGPIKNEYTGTIKDGRIDMFNGDPESDITLEIVFNKK